jgi:drug/metabolite transporter (DMT)-like permease
MKIALAYLGIVMIWATTPLAVKWSGESDWLFGVAARTLLGALLIVPFVWWLSKQRFDWKWPAIKVYLVASIPILGGMTAMYWAAQYLPSGWIGILFGMTPVMTGIMAHYCLPNSRLTLRKSLGVLISLAGLVVIFAPNLREQHAQMQLAAIAMALLSVVFHSYGTVLIKRINPGISALHLVAAALWITVAGHFLMAPLTLFHWPDLQLHQTLAIFYAASVGSVLGFMLYFYLLKHVDAIKVALIPVITPIFALLIGHWFNGEVLNATVWLGAAMVVMGLVTFEWRFKGLKYR